MGITETELLTQMQRRNTGRESNSRLSTVLAPGATHSLRLYWVMFALNCVLMCAPLWATTYPPLLDYPNHLARAYVSFHYADVPAYHQAYRKLTALMPNMAIDLAVPPLLYFFEVKTAGKLFLTLMFLLFAIGCHSLGVAIHGRPTWLAQSFVFLVFNQTVFWGFVNYFVGVGMFLISISYWMRCRGKWNGWRLGIASLLFVISYLMHLSAYAFLGVTVTVLSAFAWRKEQRLSRQLIVGLAPLVPPLLTFIAFMRGPGERGKLVWAGALDKFLNLSSWPIGYHYWVDGAALGVLLLLGLWLWWRAENWRIAGPVLVTGALFWLMYLLCPLAIFTSYSADIRFVAPAILFTLLAVRFSVPRSLGVAALAIFMSVSVVRLAGIWEAWRRIDQKTAAQTALFQHLSEGAHVYPITFFPVDKESGKNERPLHHVIHYSTIYQHTLSPTFFANPGQQPMLFQQRPRYVKITQRKPPEAMDWSFIFNQNDYIWGYRLDAAYRQYLAERCDIVAENAEGLLLRIRKADAQEIAAHKQ